MTFTPPAANVSKITPAQKRLYFLYQFNKNSTALNTPRFFILDGSVDRERITQAFRKLIARHTTLCTSFHLLGEEPVQKIDAHVDFEVEFHEASLNAVEAVMRDFVKPFVLEYAPLFRVGLVRTGHMEHVLLLDAHSIVCDGLSEQILINEFISLYREETLAELPLSYKDYVAWQQTEEQETRVTGLREFWLREFSDEPDKITLPYDFDRPAVVGHQGAKSYFALEEHETQKLVALADREQVALSTLLLSIYAIMLGKLSHEEDVVIGVSSTARPLIEFENMIGMFANTIPMRNQPTGSLTFREFLVNTQTKTLECLQHHPYPFETLIDDLKLTPGTRQHPLIDVSFEFSERRPEVLNGPGFHIRRDRRSTPYVSRYDLTLVAVKNDGDIGLEIGYAADLFEPATIERFAGYFKSIVNTVVHDADIRLRDIDILSEGESNRLLKQFNDTFFKFAEDEHQTVVSMFDEQAKKNPHGKAIVFNSILLTYEQVQSRANQVATYLRSIKKINKGDLVGLVLDRDEWLFPCILGVMKAGAAYIPIDPKVPADRINTIVNDSQLKVLISRTKFAEGKSLGADIIDLDKETERILGQSAEALPVSVRASDLAYIIYTSGSTGKPKGVVVAHDSLYNIIRSMDRRYPLKAGDVFLLKTTYSFDVSVAELFGWFREAGSLCVLPPGQEGDGARIIDTIEKYKVTHINFVPSMFSAFLEELTDDHIKRISSLKYIFLAGEALPMPLVKKSHALETGISLENIYGPTEATIYSSGCTATDYLDRKIVPIGKPLDNISLYVIDRYRQLQPMGVAGELCIGGKALALGYFNDELLTKEKFVDNPFVPGEKMYRTGDLARWRNDGTIEYLGRIDHQVKVRGYRIELGEIESHLVAFGPVKECVVIAHQREGDNHLVAYYVATHELDTAQIRDHLLKRLPEYMVPAFYVWLEHMPQTTSGKINRKALPAVQFNSEREFVAPDGDVEETLVVLWSDVLKVDKNVIGVNRNFLELGGHSLRAMILVNRVLKQFNVAIPLQEIVVVNTVKKMADYIDNEKWIKEGSGASLDQQEEFILD